jgi:hypothetical protein
LLNPACSINVVNVVAPVNGLPFSASIGGACKNDGAGISTSIVSVLSLLSGPGFRVERVAERVVERVVERVGVGVVVVVAVGVRVGVA